MQNPYVVAVAAVVILGGLVGMYLRGNLFPEKHDPYRYLTTEQSSTTGELPSFVPEASTESYSMNALTYLRALEEANEFITSKLPIDDPLRALMDSLSESRAIAFEAFQADYSNKHDTRFTPPKRDNFIIASLRDTDPVTLRTSYLEAMIVAHLTFLENHGAYLEEVTTLQEETILMFEELLGLEIEMFETALSPL